MKTAPYIPPYKVSGKAMNLIAEIAAAIERYRIILEGPDGVRLRKINHIRTIRGTTAIEGNTLHGGSGHRRSRREEGCCPAKGD